MTEWLRIVLCGAIVFATHLLEGITGFGSSVLALPFLTPLVGLRHAVPALCALSFVMAVYLVFRSWRAFRWREFAFILLWVGLGLPCGLALYEVLPARYLCILLGASMIVIGFDGSRKTWRLRRGAAPQKGKEEEARPEPKRNIFMRALLFCGGVIQGAFGSGGPFVVIYAAKALPEKSLFRVTLSMLWLVTNGVRLAVWGLRGTAFDRETAMVFAAALPFMIAGVLVGDRLHRRVDEFRFRLCVYVVLCIAGAVMLVGNLLKPAA